MTPIQAIREKCLDCAYTPQEVKLCPCKDCALHPFRFGKNPNRPKKEYTEEQKAAIAARLKAGKIHSKSNVNSTNVSQL